MDIGIISKILNSIGLVFDIAGACFISGEIFNKFKGPPYIPIPNRLGEIPPPKKTDAFVSWEQKHFKTMKTGLVILIIGFSLQGISTWLCYLPITKTYLNISSTATTVIMKPKGINNGIEQSAPIGGRNCPPVIKNSAK